MTTEITEAQLKFLVGAKKGNYRRTISDRTGVALKNRGLVFYAIMFGWNLTAEGHRAVDQLTKNPIQCWSCKTTFSREARAEADGFCPKCGVEIELDADGNVA